MTAFIEVTHTIGNNKICLLLEKIVSVYSQTDGCVIEVQAGYEGMATWGVRESYDEVRERIARAMNPSDYTTEQPAISDADKICQAIDDVTRGLSALQETIHYIKS